MKSETKNIRIYFIGWNGPDAWTEWEMNNWQREQMPRKWRGKGGEEDRECGRRTALKEIRKEWEENGEQQQKIGVGDCW